MLELIDPRFLRDKKGGRIGFPLFFGAKIIKKESHPFFF